MILRSCFSLCLLLVCLLLMSCDEVYSAKVTVKSEVSNVRLEEIYFVEYDVSYGSLLPGQEVEKIIYGYKNEWPKTGNVAFVMSANGNKVYLETDSVYTLDRDDELEIVVDDSTPVTSF